MENINRFYVYRHIRLDTEQVFYIGVGTITLNPISNTYNELYKRAFVKANRNYFWKNIVNKTEYCVDIVFEHFDYEEVEKKEKELIKLYGRRDLKQGILCNLTDGGKGFRMIPIKKHPEDIRLKMSLASKGVKKSEEHKEKLRQAKFSNPIKYWKGKTFSETHREKLSLAKKGKSNKLKGTSNIKCKERAKRNYIIETDKEIIYLFITIGDLKKMYSISHKTFKKFLNGERCARVKKIKSISYGEQIS